MSRDITKYTLCKLDGTTGKPAMPVSDSCPGKTFCSYYAENMGVCCPEPGKSPGLCKHRKRFQSSNLAPFQNRIAPVDKNPCRPPRVTTAKRLAVRRKVVTSISRLLR